MDIFRIATVIVELPGRQSGERIGKHAGVRAEVVDALRQPRAVLSADLPVRMDDGSTRHFQAYRCRYNDALGPTKGGIRFHPRVTLEEVKALALWMTNFRISSVMTIEPSTSSPSATIRPVTDIW